LKRAISRFGPFWRNRCPKRQAIWLAARQAWLRPARKQLEL
jgi:hypothetical protein